ncbi:unnamed protein product [Didymodactylos carnosus]|uniref:AIP/AIPL N-terminal FKBP-type PPIase domain-containing protein n=2 Tax=Didymodactylos carnosus TaxID=1234261 RepID=A0A815QU56_9BILA|nr:unnamed protein product [Didymodactylos carnosus]CAF4336891.1 unnamed protein product [Didymodactylos carnosus]
MKIDGTVIEDSRHYQKPMKITLGHKLECWEQCLQTMRIGEVAKFTIGKEVCVYPTVAKQIGDYYKSQMPNQKHSQHGDNDHTHSRHCCGFMAMEQGLGYSGLDS